MKNDMEPWTAEEDVLLLAAIKRHGTSWKRIEPIFPTRTTSSFRNRYQRILIGKKERGKNRCLRCGKIKRGHTCNMNNDVTLPEEDEFELLEQPEEDVFEQPEETVDMMIFATLYELGFDDLVSPPPLKNEFPFQTSLPLSYESVRLVMRR